MSYHVDAVVVGAGVVGLACARRLAEEGLETILLESESSIGQGISSRHSEVIHAGLYYKPGSLKAKLCNLGRQAIYDYCETRQIPYQRIGKWVVATTLAQVDALEKIAARAVENGCTDVAFIDGALARKMEPLLRCEQVLHSPSTGILDSHTFMLSLLGDFERAGGVLAVCSPVFEGDVNGSTTRLTIADMERTTISATYVVNAAGLEAPAVACKLAGFPAVHIPQRCYAKGSYFSLSGKSPFQRLVYPVPETGGLGVHLTLDLDGRARFGPDVEWVDEPNYTVDAAKISQFSAAIKAYWPTCDETRLIPGYAGVRPKLGTRDNFADDFIIQCAETHGIKGLVNLFGIESPGMTGSLAIADEIAARLGFASPLLF